VSDRAWRVLFPLALLVFAALLAAAYARMLQTPCAELFRAYMLINTWRWRKTQPGPPGRAAAVEA